LINTAAGLGVAIPSLLFYRYFRGRVNDLLIEMEGEAIKLVEILHGEREQEEEAGRPPSAEQGPHEVGMRP
jgi:biopolymer transport protein ExbB